MATRWVAQPMAVKNIMCARDFSWLATGTNARSCPFILTTTLAVRFMVVSSTMYRPVQFSDVRQSHVWWLRPVLATNSVALRKDAVSTMWRVVIVSVVQIFLASLIMFRPDIKLDVLLKRALRSMFP